MKKNYDISFIGFGPNSAVTLILTLNNILDEVSKSGYIETSSIDILALDKNNDFFKGLAWGKKRSSENFSLSDAASRHFIKGSEKREFLDYLFENKEKLFPKLSNFERDEFYRAVDNYTIPRMVVGDYLESLKEEVDMKIAELSFKGVSVNIDYVDKWAMGVDKNDDGSYTLKVSSDTKEDPLRVKISEDEIEEARTNNVILGVGIPQDPVFTYRHRNYYPTLYGKRGIHDVFNNLDEDIEKLEDGEKLKIAYLGSNAAFMDFARSLYANKKVHDKIEVSVVSMSGKFPVPCISAGKGDYICKYMNTKNHLIVKAKDMIEFYGRELTHGRENGYSDYDVMLAVRKAQNALLRKLPEEEKEKFLKKYSNEFKLFITPTSPDGAKEVKEMLSTGLLTLNKGKVLEVGGVNYDDSKVEISIEDQGAKVFDYVISGIGQLNLDRTKFPVLKDIVRNIGEVNDTKKGFKVDEKMQINDGFIAVGPIISGVRISRANIFVAQNGTNKIPMGFSSKSEVFTDLENLAQSWEFNKISARTLANRIIGKDIDKSLFIEEHRANKSR